MKSNDFEGMNCSIATVMGAMGDRWGMIIMRDLLLGLRRYDELKKATNITHATLADRLKKLEENGLIERKLYQERPERYEYLPTAKGKDLGLVMLALIQVGDKWRKHRNEEQPVAFIHEETKNPVLLQTIDNQTLKPVHPQDIIIMPGKGADDAVLWRIAQAQKHANKH